MDGLGYRGLAVFLAENLLIDPFILLILKMGFGNQKAVVHISVQLPRKPVAMMAVLFKNVSPLAGFQGHAVSS
jgi:hypothetical protein